MRYRTRDDAIIISGQFKIRREYMVSDKFIIRQGEEDKTLDKVERIASCYDFKSKEVLQIRLLAEEIISVISPTLSLSPGRCWMSTDEKAFSVTIDCDAGVNGLDESTKKKLLKLSRSESGKGVFGMIGKVFEFLSVPDVDYNAVTGHRMFYTYDADSVMSGYYWNPEITYALPDIKSFQKQADEKKNEEHNLEISIIEGCADDIRVSLQKTKDGVRLEITVVKNFLPEQIQTIDIKS